MARSSPAGFALRLQALLLGTVIGLYTFWVSFFTRHAAVSFDGSTASSLFAPVAMVCATLLALYQLPSVGAVRRHRRAFVMCASCSLFACTAFFWAQLAVTFSPLLSYGAVLLAGFGMSVFVLLWGESVLALKATPRSRVAAFVVASLVTGMLLCLAASWGRLAGFSICTVCLVAMSVYAIRLPAAGSDGRGPLTRGSSSFSAGFVVAVFLVGALSQFVRASFFVPWSIDFTADMGMAAAAFVVSALFACGVILSHVVHGEALWSLDWTLVALLLLLAVAVASGREHVPQSETVVFLSIARLGYFLVLLAVPLAAGGSARPHAALCLGFAAFFLGHSVGGFFAGAVRDLHPSGLGIGLVLVALFYCIVRKTAPQDAPQRQPSSSIDVAWRKLGEKRGLTPRQVEVMLLLAKGRSSAFAAEQLGIAENTVKAHAAKVYEKLDVHHRDELITFLEQASEADDSAFTQMNS